MTGCFAPGLRPRCFGQLLTATAPPYPTETGVILVEHAKSFLKLPCSLLNSNLVAYMTRDMPKIGRFIPHMARTVRVTCECIHEIERSMNFNLYNTDYLWVPRASRAPTRGCSPARFLHCAIAPPCSNLQGARGFSAAP